MVYINHDRPRTVELVEYLGVSWKVGKSQVTGLLHLRQPSQGLNIWQKVNKPLTTFCIGWLRQASYILSLNIRDDRLAAVADIDILHGDSLLAILPDFV